MSQLHNVFPLGHRVYQGGRYLRAFDHAPDIDHYEHSILTFLGSLMPFDKQFVDHPAFPSVATIASSTKISTTTVRNKLKTLQAKGYVRVETIRILNERGHFQQSSNNHFLSTLAFEFYESVLQSRQHTSEIRRRAVGESFSVAVAYPSPSAHEAGEVTTDDAPLLAVVPNSLLQDIRNNPEASSSGNRDLFTIKREVDSIVQMWEELLKIPVSKGEKQKFFREYVRVKGNELYFLERLIPIAEDPYLASRAKSINFLFNGLDCAIKNKADIIRNATAALNQVQTQKQLSQVLNDIPGFIQAKSRNFGSVSQALVGFLLQDPISEAKARLGVQEDAALPRNLAELRTEIGHLMKADLSESHQAQLKTLFEATERLPYGHCLELFNRFQTKRATESEK